MKLSSKSVLGILLLICVVVLLSGCCCCITGGGSRPSEVREPSVLSKKDVDKDLEATAAGTPIATATPAAQAASLGTRKNPVPVGTPLTYKPTAESSNLYGSTAQITLLEVVKGEEANQRLKQLNEYYEQTNPATDDFLLAKFRLEIVSPKSDEKYTVNRHDFKASNDAGTKLYEPSYVTLDPGLDGEVSGDKPIEGWIVLESGKADAAPMIAYDSGVDASGGIWFKTAP